MKRQQWEYLIVFLSSREDEKARITHLGLLGWELCGTVASVGQNSTMSSAWPDVVKFYFKRPTE